MKYQTGGAFRRALEQRLSADSTSTGVPLTRLRKMVAFDRFLARLLRAQPDAWVVKGGLALQLRLGSRARTTKDIDMLALSHPGNLTNALREAVALDIGDWFAFEVAEPTQNSATTQGGLRHLIQALLDGRTFEQFHIDVGIGDALIEAVEYLHMPALLAFADFVATQVPCYPVTQQIAEKLHAYSRPRKSGESSRVKDFVDILLLAELGTISGERLYRAIQATFTAEATHTMPESVPPPPGKWESEFRRMVKDIGMESLTLGQATDLIQDFLNPV